MHLLYLRRFGTVSVILIGILVMISLLIVLSTILGEYISVVVIGILFYKALIIVGALTHTVILQYIAVFVIGGGLSVDLLAVTVRLDFLYQAILTVILIINVIIPVLAVKRDPVAVLIVGGDVDQLVLS